MVRLDALTQNDLPLIVEWRKANPEGARTPTLITIEQERRWFDSLQEGGCPHRYWAVQSDCGDLQPECSCWHIVGLVGLTYIDPDNRRAEVAILINPARRGQGLGKQALMLVLAKGFDDMDLEQIYGEVYHCNPYVDWWGARMREWEWYHVLLPQVKRWGGRRWDATWFLITAPIWERMRGQRVGDEVP